jgi:hypothetical protein
MDFRVSVQFTMQLTPLEFRLVARALRGAEMTADEKVEALALQEKMLLERAKSGRQLNEEWDKARTNILNAKECVE